MKQIKIHKYSESVENVLFRKEQCSLHSNPVGIQA